ncbi:uncharacterized protein BKA78DRAFT_11965 [Phyllosticta capitalensis]|uniref:uncharacterized protein n=1 Tax=Phyllosticta capitalensis TaxID=121624 RepID=UPI00312FAA1F
MDSVESDLYQHFDPVEEHGRLDSWFSPKVPAKRKTELWPWRTAGTPVVHPRPPSHHIIALTSPTTPISTTHNKTLIYDPLRRFTRRFLPAPLSWQLHAASSQPSPRHSPARRSTAAAAIRCPNPTFATRQKTPCAVASRTIPAIAPDTLSTAQSLPSLQTVRL